MKHERQFDGITKQEAFAEVLKEFPAALLQDFEFDNDTQIATFDVRAMPIFDFNADESKESFDFNTAMEQVRATETELNRRIVEVDEREKGLRELARRNEHENEILDKRHKEIKQSIKELEKLKTGTWKRVKSFFHTQE